MARFCGLRIRQGIMTLEEVPRLWRKPDRSMSGTGSGIATEEISCRQKS